MQQAIPVNGAVGAGPATPEPMHAYGNTLTAVPLSEVMRAQRDEAKRRVQEQQNAPVVSSLAAHIRRCWQMARDHKLARIQPQLMDCLRRRNGEYEPSKLARIREMGGTDIYMKLTQIKCRAGKGWVRDIMSPTGDKPWSLEATPIPDSASGFPQHVEQTIQQAVMADVQLMQQMGQPVDPMTVEVIAQTYREEVDRKVGEIVGRKVGLMERKIHDQMIEGGWRQAFDDFLEHLFTFKAAFIKGPVVRKTRVLKWVRGQAGWTAQVGDALSLNFYAPSPFDIYMSPDSTSVNDGFLIEFHRLSRQSLLEMRDVDGYSKDAIDQVLDQYAIGGLRDWTVVESERLQLENKLTSFETSGDTIDALQFWGSVPGKLLIEWGMDERRVPDPVAEYNVDAWLIGGYVIRAVINDDDLGERPYYGTSYDKVAGSPWGNALPEIMSDMQDACNAAARALINNMGMASGPMVGVNVQRLPDGEKVQSIQPWNIYQFVNHKAGISEPPIHFFQPDSNADVLMRVYAEFERRADEYTGIPAYAHGDSSVGGAGNTASGLSMLMGAATRGIKNVLGNIDIDVIEPVVRAMYNHNMRYDPDEDIKGDLRIVAKGATGLMIREQMQMRRNEFLQTTNNPTDLQIMGMEGRAELLRGAARALDLPVGKVIPTEQAMNKKGLLMQQQQMLAQQAGMVPGEAPEKLDAAGNPVAGQDARLFNQR
jgi:hypothetical protein